MYSISRFYFDTYNTITADCKTPLLERAMEFCAFYERLLSKTIEGSDVWRINHADGKTVKVSADTMAILSLAEKMRIDSCGAFNIAVGELIRLWNFTSGENVIPNEAEMSDTADRINHGCIKLEGDEVTLTGGVSIDLGGIAKGYIADQVAGFLKSEGVESALLNFGGNIITIGRKPDGMRWRIGLQSPGGKWGEEYFASIECENKTIVTSGIYERGFDVEGIRYHHIVNPKTGWPIQNHLVCVIAMGDNSMEADALTTAAFVLGEEKGIELAERYGYDYLFLNDENRLTYSKRLENDLLF